MKQMKKIETRKTTKLDPVIFEILRNAFINLVDVMGEQILRTCYSFVIYNRDFSCCLNDANGDTVAQGSRDIAVHVGTLHFTAKAVLDYFKDELFPGDIIAINDPYIGGTHFTDVRMIKPVFYRDELIAMTQCNGHWADAGGAVPGSFNVGAREYYAEGLRITPVKIWEKGRYLRSVADLIVNNMRLPRERLGDLRAQAEAAMVGERYLFSLIEKYGKEVVLAAFEETQNYVEKLTRQRIKEMPEGTWETDDYLDEDPDKEEGMIRIHTKMTIDKKGQVSYDFTGTDPHVSCFWNAGFGSAFSAVVAGTKTFMPEIPLNSGMYRAITVNLPEGTVVNAQWPIPVTGFCSGAFEKIMNSIFELWSNIMKERAMACSFNLEYLLLGGWDTRPGYNQHFMWYDWMSGGWGGKNGRDGANADAPVFGANLSNQPLEGQERLCPLFTTQFTLIPDSGGPGKWRGGLGIMKGGHLYAGDRMVMSYCCDRSRSITWGIWGGLPSYPHGAWLKKSGSDKEEFLGAIFSNVPIRKGDEFRKPSAGGGGLGDPLERDPKLVHEDVTDGYVTLERAKKDYGVVIRAIDPEILRYEIDREATEEERKLIRRHRKSWLMEEPEKIVQMFRDGEIDILDTIRKYGVIINLKTNTLLPKTTNQFREMLQRRMVPYWKE
jgi:N-methylhydantoinase B